MSFEANLVCSASTVNDINELICMGLKITSTIVDRVALYEAPNKNPYRLVWIYNNTKVRCSSSGIEKALEAYFSIGLVGESIMLSLFLERHSASYFSPRCYYVPAMKDEAVYVEMMMGKILPDQSVLNMAAYNGSNRVIALLLSKHRMDVRKAVTFAMLGHHEGTAALMMHNLSIV